MPLFFAEVSEDTAAVYEYYQKQIRISLNGMPIFVSCFLLKQDELAALEIEINKVYEQQKKYLED